VESIPSSTQSGFFVQGPPGTSPSASNLRLDQDGHDIILPHHLADMSFPDCVLGQENRAEAPLSAKAPPLAFDSASARISSR